MKGLFRFLPRSLPLLDAAGILIFTGVLLHNPALQQAGESALKDLSASGYTVPTAQSPVHIDPLTAPSRHAGWWRPGHILLRANPHSTFPETVYLRHELMHEAVYRTCSESFPNWAREAVALSFSGEIRGVERRAPAQEEIDALRKAISRKIELRDANLETLAALVAKHGWPAAPCSFSPAIQELLENKEASTAGQFSYLLMSVTSGRVFETSGHARERRPLGSLMKLPYVATLRDGLREDEARALLASDSTTLRNSAERLDLHAYQSYVEGSGVPWRGELSPSVLLGERDHVGGFPLTFSLLEAARLLRSVLLTHSDRLTVLRKQGHDPRSTLTKAPPAFIALLDATGAGAKTGTVSTERGDPIVGHLAVFWPTSNPRYLAVFRHEGIRGADVTKRAEQVLKTWSKRYPAELSTVSVMIGSLLPKEAVTIKPFANDGSCNILPLPDGRSTTTCGAWRVTTKARGARPERVVHGIWDQNQRVIVTDVESYSDGVIAAEGAALPQAARDALRAIIAWNGTQAGSMRHPDTNALCDSTHCMVYLGDLPETVRIGNATPGHISWDLVRLSGTLSKTQTFDPHGWLPFSLGGDESWQRTIKATALFKLSHGETILDIRRERLRDGNVSIRFIYQSGDEVISCERFMTLMNLPSCPDAVKKSEILSPDGDQYDVAGQGRGHGQGFTLKRAEYLAKQGLKADEILRDAFDK